MFVGSRLLARALRCGPPALSCLGPPLPFPPLRLRRAVHRLSLSRSCALAAFLLFFCFVFVLVFFILFFYFYFIKKNFF